jgi:hypothetical protein
MWINRLKRAGAIWQAAPVLACGALLQKRGTVQILTVTAIQSPAIANQFLLWVCHNMTVVIGNLYLFE